jgi:hypothetical protein
MGGFPRIGIPVEAKRAFSDGLLEFYNILSSRTFGAVYNLKAYSRTFFERLKTLRLNCGIVDEYILPTILLDKAKTF